MDRRFKKYYLLAKDRMNEKQRAEAASFLAGWLDKLSVGCLLVGLFQPEHIVGGIIGSIVCFALALTIKIRGAK